MESLITGVAIAGVVSVVTALAAWKLLPREHALRSTGACGFAAGFLAAFCRIEWSSLMVPPGWQWTVWLVLGAALVGSAALASGVGRLERVALIILVCLLASWFLVPTRASLAPLRGAYLAGFATVAAAWWIVLDGIRSKSNVVPVSVILVMVTLLASVLVADGASLRLGTLGAVGSASLAGGVLLAAWKRDALISRGLLGPTAMSLGSTLLSGQLNDGLSWPVVGLLAMAPLLIWPFEFRCFDKLSSWTGGLLKVAVAAVPLVAAAVVYFVRA